ncbi:MAG: outer membrane protein assembly factor BamD [Desulfopila sp.]
MDKNTKTMRAPLVPSLLGGLLAGLLFLGGCNSLPAMLDFRGKAKIDEEAPAQTLIGQGMDDYNVGKYFTALEYFNKILDRYPFSNEATLAELKAADCNYYMTHYPEAFDLYKQFEERHPTNEAIPYVMFQKGMTYYMRIDRVDRDTSGALEAIKLFDQLQRAYPDTPYSTEAQARIKDAKEFLAEHEFAVVQFFMRTEKYSQAEKRLRYLLAMYPEARVVPQAQNLLSEIEAGTPPDAGIKEWLPSLSSLQWPDTNE